MNVDLHNRAQRGAPSGPRRAFTLLEVLLALGLSVLLLGVIGMAVDFHLRLIGTGRAEVEHAQLARAILARMADDLRGAIQYTPSSSSEDSDQQMTDPEDPTTLEDLDRTSNLANATSLPTLPGLYGNDHELQIDLSRLPRLDQMQSVLATESTSNTTSAPGDLRTVTYFASGTSAQLASTQTGLARREIDRITASLAMEQGDSLQAQGNEEPMAPEVQDLQFRYFDGTQWLDQWDTTERSGLPMAVQIAIWLAQPEGRGESKEPRMYQLTVHLPAARPTTSSSTTTPSDDQ